MGDSAGRRREAVHLPAEKIADGTRYFMKMRLKRDVAGIVKMHVGTRNIAPESLCTRRDEGLIVLAPNEENRWARAAEIFLDFGIERDIAAIVHQQIELNLIIVRPREKSAVKRIRLRRHQNPARLGNPCQIAPLPSLRC
jgi:hypothetical protein